MKSSLVTLYAVFGLTDFTYAWIPNINPSLIQSRIASINSKSRFINTCLASTENDIDLKAMGLNELQTLLREAVKADNFDDAIKLRDELAERVSSGAYSPKGASEQDKRKMKRLSWRGLGTAPWLEDRLDSLGYKFPTTIQINAFESVNTMLGALDDDNIVDKETLEELMYRKATPGMNMGVVVSGSTGSGKTLAYLVPTLSTLSESLFTRQRIRVKSEEDIGDAADDLLARVAVQTSPTVRGHGRQQVGGKGTIATGAALSSMGKSGTDVKNTLALIVVPTRELGIQTALLLYELVGGSTKKTATDLSGLKNMFKYKGPKGVKIACILDEEEAKSGLKLQTDVAITTPKHLGKLIRDGDIIPSKLRVIVYDEADLALEQTSDDDLNALFRDTESDRDFSRLTYLVGASVTESLGQLCVKDSVLPSGKSFIATATNFAPLTSVGEDDENVIAGISKKSTLKDLGVCLDPGLRHERVIAPDNAGLLCLTRMLRKELRTYEEDLAAGKNETKKEIQRPRVVIFFPGEDEARSAIVQLRDAMWGDHKLCVLLPNTGVSPLTIMDEFKSGKTSVMLATPNSVRGLDFADLTHVYTLYLPIDDPREYVHLAGRVGRIGQMGSVSGKGGRVTSILLPKEADEMTKLAKELKFDFVDIPYSAPEETEIESDVESMRRYLEDKITLLNLADDPDVNLDEVEKNRPSQFAYEDDDDEDDDDESD
jgi:superfamily II DNA/RNA helicase